MGSAGGIGFHEKGRRRRLSGSCWSDSDDDLVSFKEADLTVINEFYCLWNIRAIHKQDRVEDQSIYMENFLGLSRVYTKDEQEQLEKEGISTIQGDFKIAGRFLASPSIRLHVAQAAKAMGDSNWNILRAMEGSSSCRTMLSVYQCCPSVLRHACVRAY